MRQGGEDEVKPQRCRGNMRMKNLMTAAGAFAACVVFMPKAFGEGTTNDDAAIEYILPSWGNGAPDLVITLTGNWGTADIQRT